MLHPAQFHYCLQRLLRLLENIKIELYNIIGQKVYSKNTEILETGNNKIIWDGCDSNGRILSSGIYMYSIRTSTGYSVNKMILIR